ncbi:hypothetical protein TrLO_g11930 [Triparma laevis f. longispina]|uniref:Uncharacterized protein n=1 Tax=Triparma laevis f. longispina TaxID=1714387 RepID=A0A9W7FQ84_9STRA|nr:hypothetical protein TrLO_g11930 [Triparma laevis f. longispina]
MPPKGSKKQPAKTKKKKSRKSPPPRKLQCDDLSLLASKITSKTSPIFHILDRRVNLDAVPADTSMYDLARRWVWDDPYRVIPGVDLTKSTTKSRRDIDEVREADPEEKVPKPPYQLKPVSDQINKFKNLPNSNFLLASLLQEHVKRAVEVRRKDVKRIRRLNKRAALRQQGRKYV